MVKYISNLWITRLKTYFQGLNTGRKAIARFRHRHDSNNLDCYATIFTQTPQQSQTSWLWWFRTDNCDFIGIWLPFYRVYDSLKSKVKLRIIWYTNSYRDRSIYFQSQGCSAEENILAKNTSRKVQIRQKWDTEESTLTTIGFIIKGNTV